MRYLTLAALLTLAGCVTSPIVPLDDGSYLVSMHTGFGLTTSKGSLIEKTAVKAQAFCAKIGKNARIKNSLATGIRGLTSVNANVVFTCVADATAGN